MNTKLILGAVVMTMLMFSGAGWAQEDEHADHHPESTGEPAASASDDPTMGSKCEMMAERMEGMQSKMGGMHRKMKESVDEMNRARGEAKSEAMARAITQLAENQSKLSEMHETMMSEMMGHMSEHMRGGMKREMQGPKGGMMECPMMKMKSAAAEGSGAKDKGSSNK